MVQPTTEVQQILGRHLTSSLFYGIPISISRIGNWLLLTDGEDVDNPPNVFLLFNISFLFYS
jgi:hypothetical protein